MRYYPTIGLEIHIELKTKSKMFCSCKNDPDEKTPNVNVCPICLGHPGTLPTINEEAIKKTIKIGLALNCQISTHTIFERKNYFYPDLPKGYQISQYSTPLCKNGFLEIEGKKIRIRRIHVEEDTGRLTHTKDYSLIDFNRAGIPLVELVTEPDIESPKEAKLFAEELHLMLRYLQVSSVNMEKGQMRIEANVSLGRLKGELGTKVEIKNLNSFKAVEKAIEYEIKRQSEILNAGKKIQQETRGWDPIKEITFPQRQKEYEHSYRYFPEPDLPPLKIMSRTIDILKSEIPELPQKKRERFKREYSLDENSIEIFIKNKDLGEYFEKVVSEFDPHLPKEKLTRLIHLTVNYLKTELLGFLSGNHFSEENILITPENFAEFISLIENGRISSKLAKIILEEMFKTGKDPSNIMEEKELVQITNKDEILTFIKDVIKENEKAIEDFKGGKESSIQFLIGQVMRKTKGKANPQMVRDLLREQLKNYLK